jgi:starvation-inducible DNA-binding protein
MSRRKTQPGRNAPDAIHESLTAVLADSYVLMAKTQACHWNARGSNFHGLHKLTEEQYEELFAAIDEIAERLRAIGGTPPSSLAGMLEHARLKEADVVRDTDSAALMLAEDNEAVSKSARDAAAEADELEDAATHDLLVSRVAAHDKAAWLLRSHLG